jgi:hypothetical protein
MALLGGAEAPALQLSGLVEEVERCAAQDNRYKSVDQMRKWPNPPRRAVTNLITALDGRETLVTDFDYATALKHKAW